MMVRIMKLHEAAIIPTYAHDTDAGMDMYCTEAFLENGHNHTNRMWVCKTGIAMEIPEGYVGLLFPRSSITKTDLFLRNSVGVIDAGYRGEITFKFGFYDGHGKGKYEAGQRIGQIIIIPRPYIEFVEVNSLTETERGIGGYGSTGM